MTSISFLTSGINYVVCIICIDFSNEIVCRTTKKEKEDLKYKRKVFKLAKDYEKAKDIEKIDRYEMPKDRVVRCYGRENCNKTFCV